MKEAEQLYGRRILVNQFIKFDPAYKYLYETTSNEKYGKLLAFTLKEKRLLSGGSRTSFYLHKSDDSRT